MLKTRIYDEDERVVLDFFGDQPEGFVVDVGADDPVIGSNTNCLLSRPGWKGVLVEPNPRQYARLKEYYQANGNYQVLVSQDVIDPDPTETDFYLGEGVSTLLPAWKNKCLALWKHVSYKTIRVHPVRLDTLLRFCKAPRDIDFLSIDCEGNDFRVMQTMSWDYYHVRLVAYEDPKIIEHRVVPGTTDGIPKFLMSKGFVFHAQTAGNMFWKRS